MNPTRGVGGGGREDKKEDDVVEVIIGPLKTTKINEVEKNITEIRKADRESIEKIAKKIEKQPPEEPEKKTVQNKNKSVASTKASVAKDRLARKSTPPPRRPPPGRPLWGSLISQSGTSSQLMNQEKR